MGYTCGWLGIFDIQKDKTLKNIQALSSSICSVAFTQDNQSAFISDLGGKIKMIKWTPNATSENDFDFNKKTTQVGQCNTYNICLTRDDKNLLVGSDQLVSVYNIKTRNVTKEFKLNATVKGIKLIDDGTNALIAEINNDLTIINLETMEMSPSHRTIDDGENLQTIEII